MDSDLVALFWLWAAGLCCFIFALVVSIVKDFKEVEIYEHYQRKAPRRQADRDLWR